MSRRLILQLIFLVASMFMLNSCGSETTSPLTPISKTDEGSSTGTTTGTITDNSSSTKELKSGVFVDTVCTGLEYTVIGTNGEIVTTGSTNEKGEFQFTENSKVIFKVGNTQIGEVNGLEVVTLFDVFEDSSITDKRLLFIARLLQTLDSDEDTSNGITITEETKTSLNNLNISDLSNGFDVSTAEADAVLAMIAEMTGKTAVSENDAQSHLVDSIAKLEDKVETIILPVHDAHCPYGGVEKKFSVDFDGDGSYETYSTFACDEVTQTEKIANFELSIGDENCPNGGIKTNHILRLNGVDIANYDTYQCNGGDQYFLDITKNEIKVTLEVGDSNCPNGGEKVTTEVFHNSVLDHSYDDYYCTASSELVITTEKEENTLLAGDTTCYYGGLEIVTKVLHNGVLNHSYKDYACKDMSEVELVVTEIKKEEDTTCTNGGYLVTYAHTVDGTVLPNNMWTTQECNSETESSNDNSSNDNITDDQNDNSGEDSNSETAEKIQIIKGQVTDENGVRLSNVEIVIDCACTQGADADRDYVTTTDSEGKYEVTVPAGIKASITVKVDGYEVDSKLLDYTSTESQQYFQFTLKAITNSGEDEYGTRTYEREATTEECANGGKAIMEVQTLNGQDIEPLKEWVKTLTCNQESGVTLENSVIQGSASTVAGIENSEIVIDSAIVLDSATEIDGFNIVISSGYLTGDLLSFDSELASTFGISGNFDADKGVLFLTGTTTGLNWQTVLATVKLVASDAGVRSITMNAGSLLGIELDGCMHYYEYLNIKATWTDAEFAAASRSYQGRKGYLATITSETESNFINTKVEGKGWIGASDSETEGTWKWVTGPEAGTAFWSGVANGEPINDMFNNWRTNKEPNDYQTCTQCKVEGGEDYALAGWVGDTWNDYPNGHESINGYVVEYGCMDSDNPVNISMSYTVTVAGEVDLITLNREMTFEKLSEYAEVKGLSLIELSDLKLFSDRITTAGEYWTATLSGDKPMWLRTSDLHQESGNVDFYKRVVLKASDSSVATAKSFVVNDNQANWYQASYSCNEAGLRLPTVEELKSIYYLSGLPEGEENSNLPKAEYWTADIKEDHDQYGDSTAVMMRIVGANEDYKLEEYMQKRNYKRVICVTPDEGEELTTPVVTNINGVLWGDDQTKVASATVSFQLVTANGASADKTEVTTNEDGEYSVESLSAGKYIVTYSKEGYTSTSKTVIIVNSDQKLDDIGLTVKVFHKFAVSGANGGTVTINFEGAESVEVTLNEYGVGEYWFNRTDVVTSITANGDTITNFSVYNQTAIWSGSLGTYLETPDNYETVDNGCGGEARDNGWCQTVAVNISSQFNSAEGTWTYTATPQDRSDVSVEYYVLGIDEICESTLDIIAGDLDLTVEGGIQSNSATFTIKPNCGETEMAKTITQPIHLKLSNGEVFSTEISAPICISANTVVSGRVADSDGNPASNTKVFVDLTNSPIQQDIVTTTDENGNYSISVPKDVTANLGVEANAPQYMGVGFASISDIQLQASQDSETVNVELNRVMQFSRYTMKAIENGQTALSDVTVEYVDANGVVVASQSSDSTGSAVVTLPFGSYTINYSKEGYIDFSETITLGYDTSGYNPGGHIELEPKVSTSGNSTTLVTGNAIGQIVLGNGKSGTYKAEITYDFDTKVYTYKVTKTAGDIDLSHWGIGLDANCLNHIENISDNGYISQDKTTGNDNVEILKWDTTGGEFSFKISDDYIAFNSTAKKSIFFKAGNSFVEVQDVLAPQCFVP